MALAKYKQKRDFKKTKEPEGQAKSGRGALKFVVQKHDASHLHYDFRLELEGVLKSWAIPKGPSLNPEDKRLAMAVEDHPYDYKDFEGVIPEGEYGGGTVIVWDKGFYTPMNADGLSRKEQEKLLLSQLKKGDLKLHLEGEKLKGDFALFQMKGRGENAWLLVKKKDAYANAKDIRMSGASVKSGKTLAEVAADNDTEVKHPEADVSNKKTAKKKITKGSRSTRSKATKATNAALRKTEERPMPRGVVPMMAILADEPFDSEDWIYEIKWDGYRAVAYCKGKDVELQSRNLKSFTRTYTPIAEALQALKLNAVLDGEIIAINDKGLPDFQLLQNWQNSPAPLQYLVFDLIWLNGRDLSQLPLLQRKQILEELLPENDVVKYSEHIVSHGKDFFKAAVQKGLEGIMAKLAESKYLAAKRSDNWLKLKATKRQEVVIGGYTAPRNSREYFGALLLGVYDGGELVYVGHTGSGFNAASLKAIHEKLQVLKTAKCPFANRPKTNQPASWVKPELVCEIKFSEWTKEGIARHPIFIGLRDDKKPKDVVMEEEQHITAAKAEKNANPSTAKNRKSAKPVRIKASVKKSTTTKKTAPKKSANTKKAAPKKSAARGSGRAKTSGIQLDLSEGTEQVIKMNQKELKLTNLDKLYWKKEKFSKGDMLNYYLKIAPYIMPHLKDRPLSLNRHPNGISGKSFYQKDVKGKVADWIQTHAEVSDSTKETVNYFVCLDEAHLIYMANLGCIEMNPWHSRIQSPDKPDWCLIDLDPDTPNTYNQVIEVAHVVKQVLDSINIEAYPKTSGSSGIHIFIPLGAKYSYEQSRQLAELIVHLVHYEMPDITSLERSPSKRKGKIYLDYLQNRYGQTAASAYSLRPKPGVPVSTPLHWEELIKGLKPTDFNAFNIFDRLENEGDLFLPVLGKGINMQQALKTLQSLLE